MNTELLLKVKEHILAEPRRVNMRIGAAYVTEERARVTLFLPQGEDIPPCGTVACIAGWACLLGGKLSKEQLEGEVEFPWGTVQQMAREVLGIDGFGVFHYEDWPGDLVAKYRTGDQQQKANAVAERIDRLIATGE